MNRTPRPLAWLRLIILAALLLLLPAAGGQAAEPVAGQSIVLPLIAVPPGTLIASGEAELRAAVEAANAAGQAPRIVLAADIDLTAPLPAFDNAGGGLLTLSGGGHTLDGNLTGTVLAFGRGLTAVIEDLTITGGSGDRGQAADCGGGIYSEGRLTVRRSRVAGNQARRGGGICAIETGLPATLTLEETTVAGNVAFGGGGGLYAATTANAAWGVDTDLDVSIAGSLFENNTASAFAGGIGVLANEMARLQFDLTESSLLGNKVTFGTGGGLYADAVPGGHAELYLTRSTVASNTAQSAAGLFLEGSSSLGGVVLATAINSTFSSNISFGDGGAITNHDLDDSFPLAGAVAPDNERDPNAPPIGGSSLTLLFSTVAANRANRGSGIFNSGRQALVHLSRTLVAGNEAAGRDCWQPVNSAGYNLDGDGSCGLDQPTDVPRGVAGLGPLALNPPGRTMTHALGPASAARDRIPVGPDCDPAGFTDQRGVPRPQGPTRMCDIGAVEMN